MPDSAFGHVAIPPDFWPRPDARGALASRDMGELFRLLRQRAGISQMRIGAATGNAQGRISDIARGKYHVTTVDSFTRIADGLNMPDQARLALGLAPGRADGTTDRLPATPAPPPPPAPPAPAASNAAALAWLVSQPDSALPESGPGRAVGHADVARVRATSNLFAQLDNRFGGAHARRSLIHYLRYDAAALLGGRYTDDVGRDLFAAVAEAALLAAWTSYDCGLHGLAQRYFIHALRLAESAADRHLACSVMSAMSHQATFLGHLTEAASLARAAQTGLGAQATPRLMAQFLSMEARALARAGDARACHAALT